MKKNYRYIKRYHRKKALNIKRTKVDESMKKTITEEIPVTLSNLKEAVKFLTKKKTQAQKL